MDIRKAEMEDMPALRLIYAAARRFMRETGNPSQWGEDRPEEQLLIQDIALGRLYVCEEQGRLCASFAFIPGEDPTYKVIYEGAWLNREPYAVLHRVASDGTCRGMLEKMLAFCRQGGTDLRIDTHRDNRVMQHLLEKNGFKRCGIIHLLDGDERVAYQWVSEKEISITK